jgi:hypothetical protein
VKFARNLGVLLVLLFVVFLLLGSRGTASSRAKAAKAASIQVRNNKSRVLSILGQPTETIAVSNTTILLIGGAAERWSYASSLDFLDWHHRYFPWIASLKFHFDDTNDVAVYFDTNGLVSRVQIPKR